MSSIFMWYKNLLNFGKLILTTPQQFTAVHVNWKFAVLDIELSALPSGWDELSSIIERDSSLPYDPLS